MNSKDSTKDVKDVNTGVDQKRRQSVKKALATVAVPGVIGIAHKWEKPAIESVFLPAHANTTDTGTEPDTGTTTPSSEPTPSPEPTPLPEQE